MAAVVLELGFGAKGVGTGRRGVPRGRCGAYIGAGAGPRRADHARRGEARAGGVRARARVQLEVEDALDGRGLCIGDREGQERVAVWAGNWAGGSGLLGRMKRRKREREKGEMGQLG